MNKIYIKIYNKDFVSNLENLSILIFRFQLVFIFIQLINFIFIQLIKFINTQQDASLMNRLKIKCNFITC